MKAQKIFLGYLVVSASLLLYSYTQVDLNLTISEINIFQTIQKAFQHIGYYQRPLSTAIYLGVLTLLFWLYGGTIRALRRGQMLERTLWRIIGVVATILWFSYPAFSYDIFNYMFDAKTVLVYHKSPYVVAPQEFAGVEPWLSFMRWVHLPSIYAPGWIVLTIPFYLLGLGFFLPTLWSFKLLATLAYLTCVWLLKKIPSANPVLAMAIFALNPLVIIESLVSGHNDVVMMAFALMAIYLLVRKKTFVSWLALSASVAIKLVTICFLPVMILTKIRPSLDWRRWGLVAMLVGLGLVLTQREVLPWYHLWIIPFVALLSQYSRLIIITTGASLGLLLRYAPYLYLGYWDPPVPIWKWWLTAIPVGVSLLLALLKHSHSR